jgi:hypothetical protein
MIMVSDGDCNGLEGQQLARLEGFDEGLMRDGA